MLMIIKETFHQFYQANCSRRRPVSFNVCTDLQLIYRIIVIGQVCISAGVCCISFPLNVLSSKSLYPLKEKSSDNVCALLCLAAAIFTTYFIRSRDLFSLIVLKHGTKTTHEIYNIYTRNIKNVKFVFLSRVFLFVLSSQFYEIIADYGGSYF